MEKEQTKFWFRADGVVYENNGVDETTALAELKYLLKARGYRGAVAPVRGPALEKLKAKEVERKERIGK